jgi:hypothetical protein
VLPAESVSPQASRFEKIVLKDNLALIPAGHLIRR